MNLNANVGADSVKIGDRPAGWSSGSKEGNMSAIRNAVVQVLLVFAMAVSTAWAGPGTVTVMTKNMDAGTDFGFFFANLQTDPALGVQLTFEELQKNDFAGRASLLASEIAAKKPDIVGLQEVTLLRVGPNPANLVVVVDQLDLLLQALAAQGESYYVVETNELTDLVFQVSQDTAVRFTDHDVIIARRDSELSISNPQHHVYGTILSFPDLNITVPRGWISADVTAGAQTFRFVTTHLESSGGLYGNAAVDLIQAAQAAELAATFMNGPYPVVIAADFNSNATPTPPEQTASFGIMLNSGYIDAWRTVHRGIPGFTWPMYLEDPLRPYPNGPFERIDFVFARDLSPTAVERTGVRAPRSSDHAGVVATFDF